ncbi:hypothetical protein ABK905_06575 [Acerihabitans sp. KWT182]|uniref:ATPase AAA-type core domain-containing protein n=1 Tax=Acerihabitans sp. KWT182 TaxID=3157919 RepID=A0AAU7QCF8_9GAMM
MKPKVLVLDEPFNALDPRAASHLVHMLNDINKTLGITLIFTLHDMDIVPLLADKVYLMNQGEMVLAAWGRFSGKKRSCVSLICDCRGWPIWLNC